MNTLLIVDRSLHYLVAGILHAFQKLQIQAWCYEVNSTISLKQQRQDILTLVKKNHINCCLIINDLCYNQEFFVDESFFRVMQCYLWFVDTAEDIGMKDPCFHLYKKIFSFEPHDITYYEKIHHRKIQYLPLTMNEQIFSSKFTEEKQFEYDICFVGLVAGSVKRIELLETVAKYCFAHDKKMICYGHFWHNSHFLQSIAGALKFRIKHPVLYKYVMNKKISPEKASALYRKTRINLNIHVERHSGFNCRTFEILGNGNFELCDSQNPYGMISLIDGEHLALYRNEEELLKKINYYLENKKIRKKIAYNGGKYVNDMYSLENILSNIFQ